MESPAEPLSLRRGRHAEAARPVLRAWTDLVRLVLPVSCPGCGRPDDPLCRTCRNALPHNPFRVNGLRAAGAPETWSGGDYAGTLQRLVLAYKDDPPRGRPDLQPVLASSLSRAARAALSDLGTPPGTRVGLVPVPSTRGTVRRRGGDLTSALARHAASRLRRDGWDAAVLPAVRRRGSAGHQAGLSASERARNLTGVLAVPCGARLAGLRVLIVDDVVTTGASLEACARLLASAGADVLGAATVAATPLLYGPLYGPARSASTDRGAGLSAPASKD